MNPNFNLGQQPTAGALQLGLPNNQQSVSTNFYQTQQPPNPYSQSGQAFMAAAGINPAAELAPPSDLEVMAALIQTSVPVDRWLAGPNLQNLVSLLYKISALATIDVLKNVKVAETDSELKFDFSEFASAPTVDSVTMEANNLQTAATLTRDQAAQQQQAILNMVQQNLMSGALSAAMANPGFMESVGTTVGNVARGIVYGRT